MLPARPLVCFLLLLPPAILSAQVLDPLIVTATRAPQSLSSLPVAAEVFAGETLTASPALAIDEVLKASAAFSLFRRQSSLSANPTTQGVSLRNLGPNGAGRTLVLLDGIPLNDPFGGWVAWTKAPRLNLALAEIVRGGGSSTWGSAALGGTVQLLSTITLPPTERVSLNQLQVEAGDFGTVAADLASHTTRGRNTLSLHLRGFHSDGFARTAPAWRGPIDRPTDLDHATAQLAWTHLSASGTRTTVTARAFTEERGNGTPLQRNRTREALLSVHATGTRDLFGHPATWAASAYGQTQEFSNLFTSVTAARDAESPVLDQYAVPADAAGAALTASWTETDHHSTLGADLRWVQGETRERYFVVGDDFSRERHAGGTQSFVGLFAHHDRQLTSRLRGSVSGRLDAWFLTDPHRTETDRATGAVLRDDDLPDRDGLEFSPRAGLVWQATESWRWHAAATTAFRLPTLNELYRPFRVGNVITEANPNLAPETLRGVELGTTVTTATTSLRLTAFANRLTDAVANLALGTGPGFVPGVGFVPAGGLGRRRENLDRVDVNGFELTASWHPEPHLHLRADYLYSEATDHASGTTLPQVPRHTVVIGADWQPTPALRVTARLRHLSAAFEDDANTLVLDAATTVDLRASARLSERVTGFIAVENLFDEAVVTRRTATGLTDLGTPRFSRAGLRWTW